MLQIPLCIEDTAMNKDRCYYPHRVDAVVGET